MRFHVLILPALLMAGASTVQAQAGAAPEGPAASTARVLALSRVLEAARANLEVSIAQRAAEGAAADVRAADRAPTPVLSAKASAIDLDNGVGGGNLLRDKRIDKSLGLDWTLERGNKRQLRTRTAERAAAAAREDLAETVVQQQIAAAQAYYDLLAAQERLQQVSALERSAGELASAAQRRLRAGDIAQQEALRADIESRRAQAELRGAQAERVRAQLALAQISGLQADMAVEALWPDDAVPQVDVPDVDQRPDVRAARERVDAAQAAFDNALALRRNDVTVGASLDHFPGTSRRQLELRVQVPLAGVLGSYDYEGEIARARAVLEQARDQLDKSRRAASADQLRLLEDLRAAATRSSEFRGAIVPSARQVASMAELAYAKGALPLSELIEARRTLRAVLLDEIAARNEHARAAAAWQLRRGSSSL